MFFGWHLQWSKLVTTTGLAQGNLGCQSGGWAGWAVPYTEWKYTIIQPEQQYLSPDMLALIWQNWWEQKHRLGLKTVI